MTNKALWILLIVFVFIAGAAGSYFYMKHFSPAAKQTVQGETQPESPDAGDFFIVRIFQPRDGRLEMTEKKLPRRTKNIAVAEAVIEEFFRRAGNGSHIPRDVKLLGLYRDINQVLYVDLSDELRRNFQGDAFDEYLVLKGMYESLISNVQDFQDLKVLVEGKEIESLGGHFYLKYPLKNTVLTEPKAESKPANE